jgi:hypothetical protein
MHNPLSWDEWNTSFVHSAGFLPLAHLVTDGLPMMDSVMLVALVDWWHLKTHTFHLPCGETMVMLQDVIMILRLPINSSPVCGTVTSSGWRDFVGATIGM